MIPVPIALVIRVGRAFHLPTQARMNTESLQRKRQIRCQCSLAVVAMTSPPYPTVPSPSKYDRRRIPSERLESRVQKSGNSLCQALGPQVFESSLVSAIDEIW